LVPTESLYATSYESSIVTIRVSSIISEIQQVIGQKFPFFCHFYLPETCLEPLRGKFPWNIGYESCYRNTEPLGYILTVKPHDPTVISFESTPACDGQTDETDGHTTYAQVACSSIAKHDKNWTISPDFPTSSTRPNPPTPSVATTVMSTNVTFCNSFAMSSLKQPQDRQDLPIMYCILYSVSMTK